MPLIDITVGTDVAQELVAQIGDSAHTALVEALGVPTGDHFQVHARASTLVYDPGFLGVQRSDGFLVIRIFLARGRTVTQKKALFKRLAELLEQDCAIRPEDVFVVLIEVGQEDFSFGCGLAQYADQTPAHLLHKAAAA